MAELREIVIPDIGDIEDVDVVEVLVAPGDQIKGDDSLITLESDKATMDVPAPFGGTVREVKVKAGDKVREGSVIVMLEVAGGEDDAVEAADATEAGNALDTADTAGSVAEPAAVLPPTEAAAVRASDPSRPEAAAAAPASGAAKITEPPIDASPCDAASSYRQSRWRPCGSAHRSSERAYEECVAVPASVHPEDPEWRDRE